MVSRGLIFYTNATKTEYKTRWNSDLKTQNNHTFLDCLAFSFASEHLHFGIIAEIVFNYTQEKKYIFNLTCENLNIYIPHVHVFIPHVHVKVYVLLHGNRGFHMLKDDCVFTWIYPCSEEKNMLFGFRCR